jgi:transcriptional regulator with XRE-family HTH domain
MSKHDPYEVLGRLVIQGRGRLDQSQAKLSRESGLDPRTIRKFEQGDSRDVFKTKYTQLERALGWREGAVLEVLNADQEKLNALRAEHLLEVNAAVARASALTIEELLMELTYRVRDLQDRAEANEH